MRKKHYVNNRDFLEAFKIWKSSFEPDKPPPQMPNYLGECILKISSHLSYRPNFLNYSYRDEMVSDAIENCIRVLHNFNPERSENIFAYVTQICWNAFIRRIQAEQKQSHIKGKLIMEMPIEELFDLNESDSSDDGDFHNQFIDYLRDNSWYQVAVEKKEKKKKEISLHEEDSLEVFMQPEENEQ